MAELEFPAIEQAVAVRPGDVLLLRLRELVTPEQFKQLREVATPMLAERLPGVEVVYLAGDVFEQVAVFRPEDHAEADPT